MTTHRLLPSHLSGFRTEADRSAFQVAYDRVLAELWPVRYESAEVETRFGSTHSVVSGRSDAPPLLLLHGAGLSATSWYPNIAEFSEHFRVYALDFIVDRGRGYQTRLLLGEQDCALWVGDALDGLGIDRASIVGLSQGGWVAACAGRFIPERVGRLALLAPAATFRPFRLPFWLLLRGLQDVLPKGEPVARAHKTFRLVGLTPDERFVTQVALGSQSFRNQRPLVFPRSFRDEDLRRITAPTLLLIAEKEVLYSPRRALERARRLIPNLESAVVPGAGHFVAMARPDFVNPRVVAFLLAPTPRTSVTSQHGRTDPQAGRRLCGRKSPATELHTRRPIP
jgi:pimeloyl-ACP methyl ester carboxylesterase